MRTEVVFLNGMIILGYRNIMVDGLVTDDESLSDL